MKKVWTPWGSHCRECGHLQCEHGAGLRCPNTMIAVYGMENPTMQWLRAHAPQVLEERAGAVFQPDEEDICGE